MSIRIDIDSLIFYRAGSDFLGLAWSAHVSGFRFTRGGTYTIVRKDKSTYNVIAGPTSKGTTIIIEEDMYFMTDYANG
jgi:hypothetical protein